MGYFSNAERAGILVQALPYIRRYYGRSVVIKYGGAAMINEELKQQVMEDTALLHLVGVKVTVVHGGGPEITEMMEKLGKKSRFVNGLRVTDRETVEIAQMVLSGKVNKTLVNLLSTKGVHAIGLSGVDGRLIEAEMKDEALGYVGKITKIDPKPINDLLASGYVPIVSTLGSDKYGNIYNVNADTAAAHIAGALGAERLILMTDTPGLLTDKDDPTSLVKSISVSGAEELCRKGFVSGGMIPKIECCKTALGSGVKNAVIMDGRVPHSILMELLTDEGAGTMITGE